MVSNSPLPEAQALRECLRQPIPELFWSSFVLEHAVSEHLLGNRMKAAEIISSTNTSKIRVFLKSLWGGYTKYNTPKAQAKDNRVASTETRQTLRMPSKAILADVLKRDGYRCRYCTLPVIPKEVRVFLNEEYPLALPWGRKDIEQHAAFQAHWLQFDHVRPHSAGGTNHIENIVVCCAGCNFGKAHHSLTELELANPFDRSPIRSNWIGLTQLFSDSK